MRLLAEEAAPSTALKIEEDNSYSVIQFSTERFFVKEEEGKVSVDVIRIGDYSGRAAFKYYTVDASAKSSGPQPKYVAAAGEMVFEGGESMKTIHVYILPSDQWDSTSDFGVEIKDVRGAQMGQALHKCRVSILDDDAFPTNKYKTELCDPELIEHINGIGLMIEYCRMNLQNSIIFWDTVKLVLLDQIKNVYFYMTIYLQMYLIDEVLGGEGEEEGAEERRLLATIRVGATLLGHAGGHYRRLGEEGLVEFEDAKEEGEDLLWPGSRTRTAMIIGLLYIIPFACCHAIDTNKACSRLPGNVRLKLQANLLRKFLNFKEKIRDSISTGDLVMAMTRDIPEVVDFGYMKILALCYFVGKVSCVVIFILSENKKAAVPLIVFPVIFGFFLCSREKLMVEANEEQASRQNDLAHTVQGVTQNYRLIADFNLRSSVVHQYEDIIHNYNTCQRKAAMIMTTNAYLPPWLTTVLVGGYIIFGVSQIESGLVTLGAFVATINVFKELGVELTELYMLLMEIQKVTGPLRKIAYYLNLPTDMEDRLNVNRERRRQGAARRQAARKNAADKEGKGVMLTDQGMPVFTVDMLPIELESISFSYTPVNALLSKTSAQFAQGKLYAFIGPEHQGKATILKLLSNVLIPEAGTVFVPPHMRVLHISNRPFFLNESLLRNVSFYQDLTKPGLFQRVRRVCERCGFSQQLLGLLDKAKQQEENKEEIDISVRANWASSFTTSDFARLNLARALFHNPNALMMHMPFVSFSDGVARTMIELLREHIEERGIELPPQGRKFRRPRTVFITSSSQDRCLHAHIIYEVTTANGMRVVPHVR